MMTQYKRRYFIRGFTLLELMVSLVIFAVTSLVVLEQTTRSLQQQTILEEKTLGLWLAENTIAKLQQEKSWPAIGNRSHKATFAGREWHIDVTIENTGELSLRKVIVNIAAGSNRENKTTTLVGFLGNS